MGIWTRLLREILAHNTDCMQVLEAAYAKIRGELESEPLDRLRAESPALFERIVIELLVKMGYGGSRAPHPGG